MSVTVNLYTRDGCELCEHAIAMAAAAGVEVTPVDISGSVDLLERYGNSIPVMSTEDKELFWPFSVDEIRSLAGN